MPEMFARPALWPEVQKTAQSALQSGALQPISTCVHSIRDKDLTFVVRVVDSLSRKPSAKPSNPQASTHQDNPFLPYEEALFVTHLSETHLCLLNKFNVVDHHLLIVTRQYESQQEWLNQQDFEALAQCLSEIDGLGFYNSGEAAGASQHHKHLQLIPYRQAAGVDVPPMAETIAHHRDRLQQTTTLSQLPFQHSIRFVRLGETDVSFELAGKRLVEVYQQIMADLAIDPKLPQPNKPYNLLVTQNWMMGVARSQASYEGIGVNSLGYSGWLLVKNEEELEKLCAISPLNLLTQVGQAQ